MNDYENVDLRERAQSVLKGLIRRYIEEGAPIGSRTVAQDSELLLSPATIRNVMSDLEHFGLIHAPHTSAGRIPTEKGYRVFINSILQVGPVSSVSQGEIAQQLGAPDDPNALLTNASEMLSKLTSFAGVVSMPNELHGRVRQIEFLSLSGNRVLAILVTEDGQVQNKVLKLQSEYTQSELERAMDCFNATYSGKSLHVVRQELLGQMKQDYRTTHKEMRAAVMMAGQLLDNDSADIDNLVVSGENNLLAVPDFSELDRLRQLFDTLKTKQILFDLLQKSMTSDGVNIFVGEESGYQIFKDCSVIASSYQVDNQKVGVLGVIGPTRMQYDEVISAVDNTAKFLGSALSTHSASI